MKVMCVSVTICSIALGAVLPDTLWSVYDNNPWLEYAADGVVTQNGGYAFAGTSDSLLTLRIFDSGGSEVLSRTYEVPYAELVYAQSIDQLADGGFLIGGESADDYGVFIRTDTSADTLWTAVHPEKDPYSSVHVLATSDGGYVLMYEIPGSVSYSLDLQIQKYDAGDLLEWEAVYDSYFQNCAGWVGEISDGSFIVAGNAVDQTFPASLLLIRFDSNGSVLWSRTHACELFPYLTVTDCCITDDGGYCAVGHSDFNSIMVKVDADGKELWRKEYIETRALQSICTIGEGNMVAGGFAGNFNDAYLFAVNSVGETLWGDILGLPGQNYECVCDIVYDEAEQQFLVAALTAQSLNGRSDYWISCYCSGLSGFSSEETLSPDAVSITGIAPNPFAFSTEISVLTEDSRVADIAVYDLSGHLVRSLHSGDLPPGETVIKWDCRNHRGERVPPGVYFCSSGRAGSSIKMVLITL